MSSHHIVREKQEPALLINMLHGFDPEYLGQLLEWSPTVIVVEDLYEHADSLGIKIDAVLTSNPHFSAQESTRIILTDNNYLKSGLLFLIAEEYPSVNIITKKFELHDFESFSDDIDMVIYTADQKIFPIRSGFSKWQIDNEKIYVLQHVDSLTTNGLEHYSDNEFITTKDGFYSFTFEQPFIFIAENL